MSDKKTDAKELAKKLFYKPVNAGEELGKKELKKADGFCEGYMDFLQTAKPKEK